VECCCGVKDKIDGKTHFKSEWLKATVINIWFRGDEWKSTQSSHCYQMVR
jgi:hypothetical protein